MSGERRMTVPEAERLVSQVDALSPEAYRKAFEGPWGRARNIEYVRAKCLTDLWWHVERACGYPMKHYYRPLHGPDGLSGFMQDWTIEQDGLSVPCFMKVVLMARELCKTHLGVAYDLWRLAREPSTRIMVRSHVDSKAFELLGMIKSHIKSNQTLRAVYPWLTPLRSESKTRDEQWAEDRIKITGWVPGTRESSVEAYGYNADATGGHYEEHHYDDLVTKQSADSDVLRAKIRSVFQNDDNLCTGGTYRTLWGTRWHAKDLFHDIEDGELSEAACSVFFEPATKRVLESDITHQEPVLLEDRVTLRVTDAFFPEGRDEYRDTLKHCQLRTTFLNPAVKDTVTEVREIVWNDGEHIRVNREYPLLLGQPLTLHVPPTKPTAPNRHTLDAVDEVATSIHRISRQSLPRKQTSQGSYVFSCQMNLKPYDPGKALLSDKQIRWVTWADLPPEDERCWYRAVDFSSAKKTGSKTAMTTGFIHKGGGTYLCHIKYGNLKPTDIMLELFLGLIRVEDWGGELLKTMMEPAGREEVIGSLLRLVQRNPYEYFKSLGGIYADAAERFLKDRALIPLRIKEAKRNWSAKNERIATQVQPTMEARQLYVLEDIQHKDALVEQITLLTLESNDSFDILDNVADIIRYGRVNRGAVEAEPDRRHMASYSRTIARVSRRSAFRQMPVGFRG